jgi:hypothetical protein
MTINLKVGGAAQGDKKRKEVNVCHSVGIVNYRPIVLEVAG